MIRQRKYIKLLIVILIPLSSILPQNKLETEIKSEQTDIRESINYFVQVYSQINRHYADEINSINFIKSGLYSMLKTLDPYTELLDQKDNKRIHMITTGEYGGIGIEITKHKYGIMIANVMQNSPAGKHEIAPGSIIKSVDMINTEGKNIHEVSALLQGNLGDEVRLKLYNPYTKVLYDKRIKRDVIRLLDVPYFGILRKNVAYIKLTGFTENAANQVRSAILQLQEHFTFNNLILDLRDNPGGLLESAREIVNLFVDKGEIIVSTIGKNEGKIDYYANEDPLFPDLNLALLVNENTASAAEIVSGSLQDLDKAIILGTETYGKGLVQKVFSVNQIDDAKLKITTSKYYTPSGRSIQKQNKFLNTSLKTINKKSVYFTRNGRKIFDSSGIQPDVYLKSNNERAIINSLQKQGLIFDFAIKSMNEIKDLKKYSDLRDINIDMFLSFLNGKEFSFEPAGLKELETTLKIAIDNNYNKTLIEKLKESIELTKNQTKDLIIQQKDLIMNNVYDEISEKKWGLKGKYYSISKHDKLILKAIYLLENQISFKEILAYK